MLWFCLLFPNFQNCDISINAAIKTNSKLGVQFLEEKLYFTYF